tara:strand:- start:5633 stop:7669 length:2037 start_codon:yes stop_codon:yes gene_type:complete
MPNAERISEQLVNIDKSEYQKILLTDIQTAERDTIVHKKVAPIFFADRDAIGSSPDTLNRSELSWLAPNTTQSAEIVKPDTVHVWTYKNSDRYELAETDSTLRWVNMLNMADRFHQEKGAITYRMGTVGRMDGIEFHAFETRHMNLELEGLRLNDPLTGAVNWNRLPIHKISTMTERDYGGSYRAQTRLRDHYLTQPRTYLNFDESKYNYRSLEFAYTQNFRNTTNLELSFWDRRAGGAYNRQEIVGRQVVARLYHQLSDKWLLKAAYIDNSIERQEPFGYNISNPALFAFNRFSASALQSNANGEQASKDIYLQAHYRDSTHSDVSSKIGLHYQTDRWSLDSSVDSVSTDFQRLELFARQEINVVGTELSATARAFVLNERAKENLSESHWIGTELELGISRPILRIFQLQGDASLSTLSSTEQAGELTGRVLFEPGNRFHFSIFTGLLSSAPDLQSLYWRSNLYNGNDSLINEESFFAGASMKLPVTGLFNVGLRADFRNTEHAAYLNGDGEFVSIDPYDLYSGTIWLEHDSRIFESEISGTYKSYVTTSQNPVNQTLEGAGDRIWIKGNIYWKNYLFDNATFVKAGLSGVYSPNPFRTAEFITPLNRWQHGTNEFKNPSYYRVDLDVSARIRWFMVLLKWENIFDRVQQLGYFESVGYPMPERRFRFGIRVLFTN